MKMFYKNGFTSIGGYYSNFTVQGYNRKSW